MKKQGETFHSDLKIAHQHEDFFASTLKEIFEASEVIQAPKDSSFTEWDVKAIWDEVNDDFTFELKHDRNTWTGNIAAEIGRTVDGVYKDTGIMISMADVFVYFFEGNFWLIHAQELCELMAGKHPVRGGDGDRAHIILIHKFDFFKKAKKITRLY